MKKILLFLLLFAGMANAQVVNIPDANFKAKLLEADITNSIASDAAGTSMKIDTNNDGEIQESEALAVYRLRVLSANIMNLSGISSFANLKNLDCTNNILFSLDVTALTNLTTLICSGNFLSTLNFTGLSNLTLLFCDQNQLTNLNFTGATNVSQLFCSNNQFTSLNLSMLPNLVVVICDNAHISSLNVSGLANLSTLICNYNNLTSLDISGLTGLAQLQCFYNQITSLDFSNTPSLVNLSCGENSMATLNLNGLTNLSGLECSYLPNNLVINGANLNALTTFQYVGTNTNLTLNGFPAMQNLTLTLPQPTVTLNITGFSSETNIFMFGSPTTNLTVNGSGATNVQLLNCSNSQLTSLTLNGLNNLSSLSCNNNKLTSLNLSGLTSLASLNVSRNKIANITLTGLANLKHLDVSDNKLMGLDLTDLPNLEYLDCSNYYSADTSIGNQITSLNVAGLTNLKYLDCSNYNFGGVLGALGNVITSLDVNGLIHLEQLKCATNKIPALVVNGLTNLTNLDCSRNLLTSLDLIGLTNLTHLNYSANQLSNLNMTGLVNITELDCSGNSIATLNIVDMPNLTRLSCGQNLLTTLNLSGLTQISKLFCENNLLTALDVTILPNLTEFSCSGNQLTSLNVNNLTNLVSLGCGVNHLTSLDVSALTNLTQFYCANNQLTTLDVSTLTNLGNLQCDSNQLTSLDVSNSPDLYSLTCSHNQITTLNISNLAHLYSFTCAHNQLTSLDVSASITLQGLNCDFNQITSLDLSALNNLSSVVCNDNQLTTLFMKNGHTEAALDVSNNPALAYICADESELASIQTQLNTLSMTSTVANSYCSFTPGGPHNTVIGTTIFDGNNNGCNSNDPLHPNIRIDISDGTTTGSAFTNSEGTCTFYAGAGNYTVFPNIENAAAFNISPASADINFLNDNNNIANRSFCLSSNGVHPDVEVVVSPIGPARPGFNAAYKIVYKNKGNQSLSGNVALVFEDAKLDFISASPEAGNQAGNNLSWSYSNLLPFESRSIELEFNVNSPVETPAVNNGDLLNFSTSVTPVSGDELPADNQFELVQTVVGPFDPNAKTCLEGDVVSPTEIGNYLHYNIEFENIGNAAAQNVVVRDIIDPAMFDISTLQVLYASHEMRAVIRGNTVEFVFQNINLSPLEGDPPVGGHGNILFKIKTLSTLVAGDQVSNTANIFFDYNAPIETNESRTAFQALGVPENNIDQSIVMFPNPAKHLVRINCSNTIKTVQLYDIQGRILQTVLANNNDTQLDISNQSNGIYFVKVISENGAKVEKLVKE